MAGLFGGSALAQARRALLSWLPFVAAIPLLWLVQHFLAEQPDWEYAFQNINHIGIAIILAVSLNLVNGLTGQFSIGHAGFMAVGGYVSAVMLMRGPQEDPYRIFFVVAMLTGALAAALAGWLVGKPSLRLRGDYLAIVTLGFGEIIRVIIENTPFFGGAIGLSPIPHRADFTWIWATAVATILIAKRLRDSSHGRAFLSVRAAEAAAEAMVIYSVALVVPMLVRPRGLLGTTELWDFVRRRRPRAKGKREATEALIDVRRASIRFGGLTAVSDFSLEVRPRELVALIGPNGAGKTTVFNLLTGVYPPSEGTIKVLGRDTRGLSPHAIAHLGCARTFQNIRLFRELTAFDNVRIACHHLTHESMAAAVRQGALSEQEEKGVAERPEGMLEIMGLTHRRNELAKNLPYGEQRRLEIARALATGPQALLLDEPAAGTNTREKTELMALIRSIRDRFGVAIVLIEHDMKLVMGVSERILVLDHGVTIAQGLPREIQSNAKVIEAYLGEKYAKEHAAQIAAAGSLR